MKRITYTMLTEINSGTKQEPQISRVFNACEILCADSVFESNYATALRMSHDGQITVEEVEDPVVLPTTEERVTALEKQLAETDEVAIDLYEASLAQEAVTAEQDEAIIEIYEMMEGMNHG